MGLFCLRLAFAAVRLSFRQCIGCITSCLDNSRRPARLKTLPVDPCGRRNRDLHEIAIATSWQYTRRHWHKGYLAHAGRWQPVIAHHARNGTARSIQAGLIDNCRHREQVNHQICEDDQPIGSERRTRRICPGLDPFHIDHTLTRPLKRQVLSRQHTL